MDELFEGAGQQALIDAAAAKAVRKLRPKQTHEASVEAKRKADPDKSATIDPELTLVGRMRPTAIGAIPTATTRTSGC